MEESASMHGQFLEINIDKLRQNHNQPRINFDGSFIAELAASIKEFGIIEPLIVREDNSGKFTIVAGEQRYRAAKLTGMASVPCIVSQNGNDTEIALAENMLRQNLSVIEEAEALSYLASSGIPQKVIAKKFGKAASTISEYLAIAERLPEAIKEQCRGNRRYALRELKKIAVAPPEVQLDMFSTYKKKVESSIRTPSKNKRTSEASLMTAIKSLSGQLDNFCPGAETNGNEEMVLEIEMLHKKLSEYLTELRRVEV